MKNHCLYYPAPSAFRLKTVVLFLLLFTGFSQSEGLFGQQQIHHNFYRQNWQLLNPAISDWCFYFKSNFKNNPQWMLQGGARQQWILSEIEGAPQTFYTSIEYKTDQVNEASSFSKYGFTAIRDQTDALSTMGLFGNVAFTFITANDNYFSIGASPGYVFTQLDANKLRLLQPDDPVVADFEKHAAIEVPIGIYYRTRLNRDLREYYMGLSLPQGLGFNLTDIDSLGGWTRYKTPHFNAVFGLFEEFTPDKYSDFNLETSLWLRYVPGVGLPSIDLSSRIRFEHGWWAGGSIGTNLQATIEGGFFRLLDTGRAGGYRVGFSYGAPPIGRYRRLGNTLEATLAYFWR